MTGYKVVEYIDGEWTRTETKDIFAWASQRKLKIIGINNSGNPILDGQPKFNEFWGPGLDGEMVRYESWPAFQMLSTD
jgi:hypothetical protein